MKKNKFSKSEREKPKQDKTHTIQTTTVGRCERRGSERRWRSSNLGHRENQRLREMRETKKMREAAPLRPKFQTLIK